MDVLLPGALPGDYHVIVRADLYNQEKEGGDEGNNVTAVGPFALDVRPLAKDGTPAGGTLQPGDRYDYYQVHLDPAQNLRLRLDAASETAAAPSEHGESLR